MPLPKNGLLVTNFFFDESNPHGRSPFTPNDLLLENTFIIALRGVVTLDVKVRNVSLSRARGLVIIDTTGDPLGPDLDDVADIIVGYISNMHVGIFTDWSYFSDKYTNIHASKNPLGFAVSSDIEALRFYLQHIAASSPQTVSHVADPAGHSILHFAAARDSEDYLTLLLLALESGYFDVNELDKVKGQSPLHIAAHNGCYKSVKILCAFGAMMQPRKSDGSYPLHVAVLANKVPSLTALCELGYDLNVARKDGLTALLLCAQKGFYESTR